MGRQRPAILIALVVVVTLVACAAFAGGAQAKATGTLYQHLTLRWSHNNWRSHDRATFQIPGVGIGDVMCSPNTTWIQMEPSNPVDENDMWSVKTQQVDGVKETAVKEARVYRYSTPTSTIPHGTGTTAYEGFNKDTPIEASDSGSLVGLISRRAPLNQPAGSGSASTSVHLTWSWSGFHTSSARCTVNARFTTPIEGKTRKLSEGRASKPPARIGGTKYLNVNWHGETDYDSSPKTHTFALPGEGTLSGVCQFDADGEAYVQLSPLAGLAPYAEITTYQGEGTDNATQAEYYSEAAGGLGPIPLPVNGFIVGKLLPAWNAPASQETELLISSIRKVNDPDPAADYCEVAVQTISAPDPIF